VITIITSIQNNFIKNIRKLHTKKERYNTHTFLIEGFHLIEEALKSKWSIEHVIIKEGIHVPAWYGDLPITYVSERVFAHISQTETPQGIAGVVKMKEEVIHEEHTHILLIDAVQDPGNLGTIIRTADAAGFSQVVLGKGTVDLYNDKVIRATQGSLFHIDIQQDNNLEETIPKLQEAGFTVYASALEDAKPYKEVTKQEKVALILGNEGAGISDSVLKAADERIHIPIY